MTGKTMVVGFLACLLIAVCGATCMGWLDAYLAPGVSGG